jgi:hypothetical protein
MTRRLTILLVAALLSAPIIQALVEADYPICCGAQVEAASLADILNRPIYQLVFGN